MAEEVIKTTSCCNDAMMGGLLGAMANRDNNNPLAMAAMMRDRDDADMWNNPFAYMMMMGMMRTGTIVTMAQTCSVQRFRAKSRVCATRWQTTRTATC